MRHVDLDWFYLHSFELLVEYRNGVLYDLDTRHANIYMLEREVKKANREMNNSLSKMDDLQKIETLQKRVTEHLADMKRLERDNLKNKKRGDILQKEKDHGRTELSKSVGLKEKLEKLCRELQKENNRLKVHILNQEGTTRNADELG